jgi:hypothetical protein
MKRLLWIIVAIAALPALAFGIGVTDEIGSIAWNDARSMGMGGTSLLFSTGYDSFFGNPAGFAGKGSLTLGDVSLWGYLPWAPGYVEQLNEVLYGYLNESERNADMDELLSVNGKLGGGMSMGLGWAGKGFGIGFTMISDLSLSGYSYSSSQLVIKNQFNAIVGIGFPINLGFIKIGLGANARGFYRIDTSPVGGWSAYSIANAALGYTDDLEDLLRQEYMLAGLGYAVDAGITVRIGPLMAGFMARDLFASLSAENVSVSDLMDSQYVPSSGTYNVAITPTMTAGLGIKLNESGLVAPSLYAQTDDVVGFLGFLGNGADVDSILASIQVGAELRLLRLFLIRGGLNHNMLSLGAGIDLALIRGDVALFTSPFEGVTAGASGVAVRAVLKF